MMVFYYISEFLHYTDKGLFSHESLILICDPCYTSSVGNVSLSNSCVQGILSALHTRTKLTPRERERRSRQSASAKVTPTKSRNSGGRKGGVREGGSRRPTVKNNRDSQVPEAAPTSAAPVKGRELRKRDTATSQDDLMTFAEVTVQLYVGFHLTFFLSGFPTKSLLKTR